MTDAHPPSPHGSPTWRQTGKWLLAPLLVAAILTSVAVHENRKRSLDFWSHSYSYGDYIAICLSHAFNIDFWVSKAQAAPGRHVNNNNTLHPGFPLQATSWAAYRVASAGKASDAAQRCEAVLKDPSAFWLSIRVVAIVIGVGFSALYAWAARSSGWCYATAVGLLYFCYEPAWDFTIRYLANETFALPLALAVAWAASRSLRAPADRPVLGWWMVWGGLCAVCYLNKLNYIAWTVAVLPACATYFVVQRPSIADLSKRLAAFAGGFIIAGYGLVTLMLGSGGLGLILKLHFGVLTHSGVYGNGPAEPVSLTAVQAALRALTAYWPFLTFAGLICGIAVWFIVSSARRGRDAAGDSATLVYLLSAAGLFLAATLKHYAPHYLVAGVPAISLLMIGIGGRLGPLMRLALSLAVGVLLVHSYRRSDVIAQINYNRVMEMKRGLQAVDAIPDIANSPVLWTYHLPDRRFRMENVQLGAGVPEAAATMDEKFPTQDLVYFIWSPNVRVGTELVPFDKTKWKYAVFQSENYDNFDFLVQGSPAGAKEYFEKHCKRIIDGPEIRVFERLEE